MCGNCSACTRTEDCGQCDFCKVCWLVWLMPLKLQAMLWTVRVVLLQLLDFVFVQPWEYVPNSVTLGRIFMLILRTLSLRCGSDSYVYLCWNTCNRTSFAVSKTLSMLFYRIWRNMVGRISCGRSAVFVNVKTRWIFWLYHSQLFRFWPVRLPVAEITQPLKYECKLGVLCTVRLLFPTGEVT
jgi:hypothetical protein